MKILIADDSSLLRDRLKGLMRQIDSVSVFMEAENGEEALLLIREINPDVAILDIRMPEMNGIELLKRIREGGSQLKIIILTNYPYKQYRERCLAEGADYFFDKNKDIAGLTEVITRIAIETKGE
jgi:DNA-binding NarL/FixJ family response regulator